jgi:hypothetical protein
MTSANPAQTEQTARLEIGEKRYDLRGKQNPEYLQNGDVINHQLNCY